ncbi:MAG: mitofilin family membrane protein [Parvibaculum sp.]|uniref:COG4223 family protein n=1 Tax=Parvibaculum sp. TaxID=2024848 RepID=UPI0028485EA1|nr:mitofilin family membrane protein [Parvibaculum sp.]MDR3498442.1 mitofilin family membrane protein [Parvibaculum sp.]
MSDQNGDDKTPAEPEAELLGPEKNVREPRPRKDPPVIEGEAEEVGSRNASASGGASETPKPGDGPSAAAPRPASPQRAYATSIATGVVAAVVAVSVLYALGFGRPDTKGAQVLADLDTRLVSVERQSEETGKALESAGARIDAAEKNIAAEAQSPEGVAAMTARLDKIEAEADALKQSLGEASAAAQASGAKLDALAKSMPPAGLADEVAKLGAMLKTLNTALDALAPKVNEMQARVAALEAKKDDPDAAARAALGLALANLARAAETAEPFKAELDAVAAFLPKEPELAALAGPAATGVPTEASLKERFPAMVQSVLDAERRAKNDGLYARFVANIRKLVTIRRTGEISGDDTEAVIARMEERLKLDDLAAAVTEGKALKGAALEAAAPWLKDAEARVATRQMLRDLSAHVAARLAPPAPGAKG